MNTRITPRRAAATRAVAAIAMISAALVAAASTATGSTSGGQEIHTGPAQLVHNPAGELMGNVQSTNWAGYVDRDKTFTFVAASWTQPKITCTSTDAVASFWVGFDGYHAKNVEQAGTLASCVDGKVTYYTWWEMAPSALHLVGSTVRPGDKITASVAGSHGSYTLKVVDRTTPSNSFTRTATCGSCRNVSAEWIAERPSGQGGLLPFAKFDHLRFYGGRVGVGSTRGPISAFPHDAVTMINSAGATMARVSPLQVGGRQFVATWLRMQ